LKGRPGYYITIVTDCPVFGVHYSTSPQTGGLPGKTAVDRPGRLEPGHIPVSDFKGAVKHFEKVYIKNLLETNDWQRGRVVDILKINQRTLFNKIKTLGFAPEE
jgi:DNA-binding NtrC family response regulator